jgi:hypothetical protein
VSHKSLVLNRSIWTSYLVQMRDTQGNGVFAIFFRSPPTKENRRHSEDPACRLYGELRELPDAHTFVISIQRSPFRCFAQRTESEVETLALWVTG